MYGQVMNLLWAFWAALRDSWRDGNHISASLFRFLVPIVIAVKILTETGVIDYLAIPLRPVMSLVGLPAELGLSWAAAMLVNIYSGIIVFLSLAPSLPTLTVAQVTTFALMLLIAHSLILETRIAGQCGVSMMTQLCLRLVMAVLAGLGMYWICRLSGALGQPAVILLEGRPPATLGQWALGEAFNLAKIYGLIFAVMLFQRGIDYFRISNLLGKLLYPVLRMLGIPAQAASIIIVSFFMGLIYGSGIIIKSAREGTMSRHDIFCAMTLMGLAHSLLEDTLLMMLLGASMWGVLGLRLVLALTVGVIINLLYNRFAPQKAKTSGTAPSPAGGAQA